MHTIHALVLQGHSSGGVPLGQLQSALNCSLVTFMFE